MQRSATVECTAHDAIFATCLELLQSLPPELCNFTVDSDTGCWLWLGTLNEAGHGQFNLNGTTKTAHRAVWEHFFGELDSSISLHHRVCERRSCVNPLHQQPKPERVHRAEHARKRWARQKQAELSQRIIGCAPGTKRLTEEQRQQIRDLYMAREATQPQLAKLFGVSRPTIAKIVHEQLAPSHAQPAEANPGSGMSLGITGTTGRSNLGVPVAPESGLPERVGLAEGGEG